MRIFTRQMNERRAKSRTTVHTNGLGSLPVLLFLAIPSLQCLRNVKMQKENHNKRKLLERGKVFLSRLPRRLASLPNSCFTAVHGMVCVWHSSGRTCSLRFQSEKACLYVLVSSLRKEEQRGNTPYLSVILAPLCQYRQHSYLSPIASQFVEYLPA